MPGRPSVWLHELSWNEVADQLSRDDVVLVPIGATEQHGHFAPLLLDTGWAIQVAEDAAKRAGCLVAPPLHYGWSHGHMAYPGCIGLKAETLTAVAVDIGESLLHQGFRRIVLVNGNRSANLAPMEIAAVKLRLSTGALVAVADCGQIARDAVAALSDGPVNTNGHAGESEISMVLAYYPHLTDLAKAPGGFVPGHLPRETGRPRRGHSGVDPRQDGDSVYLPALPEEFRARTEARQGVDGDPTTATAAKGRAMVEAIGANLADFVAELRGMPVRVKPPPAVG
ncbi:creatininase family protein [Falsiroseomonas sp. HW251]|uniref:creatininase family protein n=1 Tax=Falsiroseomonas sp. HW251 TaxID=3390998 RepID=UPI003D30F2F2